MVSGRATESTIRFRPADARYSRPFATVRMRSPSVFTMSGSSTPSTCTLVSEKPGTPPAPPADWSAAARSAVDAGAPEDRAASSPLLAAPSASARSTAMSSSMPTPPPGKPYAPTRGASSSCAHVRTSSQLSRRRRLLASCRAGSWRSGCAPCPPGPAVLPRRSSSSAVPSPGCASDVSSAGLTLTAPVPVPGRSGGAARTPLARTAEAVGEQGERLVLAQSGRLLHHLGRHPIGERRGCCPVAPGRGVRLVDGGERGGVEPVLESHQGGPQPAVDERDPAAYQPQAHDVGRGGEIGEPREDVVPGRVAPPAALDRLAGNDLRDVRDRPAGRRA